MTIHRSSFYKFAFSTAFLTLSLNGAFAQDTAAFADRLKGALAEQSVDISWTGITGDASNMVLEGVTLKPLAGQEGLPIGKLTLEGVTEENGGYIVHTLSSEAFSRKEDKAEINISPIIIHDLAIPAKGATGPMGAFLLYKSANVANVTVKTDGKTAFSMDGFTANITPPADGKAMEFSGRSQGFTADLTLAEDPKSRQVIEALGYQNITGKFDMAGSWQPSDGKMTLSQYDITVDNAGTLGLTFDFGGYTMDFIKSAKEMQEKILAEPKDADKSALGMAMLGLMQQLTFNSASIRFNDDSLTNKVLDYVGKQQGMSGKDIANQAKAIVPFGMAQLNNPELTAQVSAAVGKFLDDPKSLEISAAPGSSVPFALIMAAAMANPLDLPKTLGVTVKANQQ